MSSPTAPSAFRSRETRASLSLACVALVSLLALLLAVACKKSESSPPPIDQTPELIEPAANRADCNAIRGTVYRSQTERAWFLDNCLQGGAAPSLPIAERACHPSYEGACLATDIGDYDCADLPGQDGPNFVKGRIKVVGPDVFQLDRNGNGIGCE